MHKLANSIRRILWILSIQHNSIDSTQNVKYYSFWTIAIIATIMFPWTRNCHFTEVLNHIARVYHPYFYSEERSHFTSISGRRNTYNWRSENEIENWNNIPQYDRGFRSLSSIKTLNTVGHLPTFAMHILKFDFFVWIKWVHEWCTSYLIGSQLAIVAKISFQIREINNKMTHTLTH